MNSSRPRVWKRDGNPSHRGGRAAGNRLSKMRFCGLFAFVALATSSYYFVVAPLAAPPTKKIVHSRLDRMEIVGVEKESHRNGIDHIQLIGIGRKNTNDGSAPRVNGTTHVEPPVSLRNPMKPSDASMTATVSPSVSKATQQNSHKSWSDSIAIYLLIGCFLFGSYILVAKCCGQMPAWVLYVIRKRVCLFRGRDVTGVHVLEWIAMVWSLGCVEAATLMHLGALVPAINCHPKQDGWRDCDHSFWLWEHALPSLYFHVTFYYNWYMCVFGTRPEDAYTAEQRQRLLDGGAPRLKPAAEDREHWSSYGEGEGERMQLGEEEEDLEEGAQERRRKKKTGPLGTEGDADRAHHCRVCKATSVRSDHHCPFMGTCIGAHNHAHFLAMVLHMALSMLYGALLILPSAFSCTLYPPPRPPAFPSALSNGTALLASQPPSPLPALTLEQCLLLLPVSAGIWFLAAALSLFFLGMLLLAALDLTLREFLSIDLLRYRAGPCAVLRRLLRHSDSLAALSRVLGPPRRWWTYLLPCRRSAVRVTELRLPSAQQLAGDEGVYWEDDADGHSVYRPHG